MRIFITLCIFLLSIAFNAKAEVRVYGPYIDVNEWNRRMTEYNRQMDRYHRELAEVEAYNARARRFNANPYEGWNPKTGEYRPGSLGYQIFGPGSHYGSSSKSSSKRTYRFGWRFRR